jgi:RNA polymerase sigma factor (sigma-70 family)
VNKNGTVNIEANEALRLAERFQRPLMSFFLRRLHDREEAEDLTQEVFLRIVGRDEGVPVENPEIYIFRIAANLLRDRARKALTHHQAEHASLDAPEARFADGGRLASGLVDDCGPERVLLSQESLAAAIRTLDELNPRTRDIYMLFRIEKMKQREIAALYGLTVSAVAKHIARAAVHLSRRLGLP